MRNQDRWFSTGDVEAMFEAFRIPVPGNTAATLGRLASKDKELVVRRTKPPPWSLTPKGRQTVLEVLGEIDPAKLESQLLELPGAELADTHQTILPPSLAPPKWAAGIKELLGRYPFDANVLCMTRFPRANRSDDPIGAVIDTVKQALDAHGLRLHLASDAIVEDTLFANVAAYMWACRYGFALFEDRVGEGLNYNVVIEVGSMVMAGRQTALLKDTTAPDMPTDLVGHIYKAVDFDALDGVARATHLWAADDLGLGPCPECPS
jgi:hypothetical protein